MKLYSKIPQETSALDLKPLINCRKIHEPCFPYFGSVYMTLLSVMQGIVFASTVVPTISFLEQLKWDWLLCFSVLIFSIVLWHKYVNHHQILGWQLGPFDTVNIAVFGLLQTVMVINATKNYKDLLDNRYIFDETIFCNQSVYLIAMILFSASLGVASYAHSGSESCKSYVKNVIVEHYNTCSKCNKGNSHCIYDPVDLYQFLVGFEARCLIGTLEICFYLFIDLFLLLFLKNVSENFSLASSVLSVVIYIFITFYFVWHFDFKREIRCPKKMSRTLEIGKFIINNKDRDKLHFWLLVVPRKFFFSFFPFSKVEKIFSTKNRKQEIHSVENKKKTALITGGATGIGYELSKFFARDKYDLILVSRDKDKLENVSRELEKEFNIKVNIISKDLSKSNSAQELYYDVCNAGYHIDILVNNAGIANYGKFTDSDIEKQIKLIQLNITSLSILCRMFGKDMASSKSGAILNIASTAAFQAGPLISTYYASKAYVLLFSEALKKELQEDNVKVTVLCPGPTKTGFFQRNNWTGSKIDTSPYLMNAEDVAECGYRGLLEGKTVVIPGVVNKMSAFLVRLLPRAVVNMITYYLNKNY